MAGHAGLKGPLSPRRLSGDPHATRPSLKRLTSRNTDLVLAALQPGRLTRTNDGVRRSLDELGPWSTDAGAEGEREALVHDIVKTDSLAGIALQYGISVQALRQANRLWASDSIHLRKVLYVPLDACTMPPAKEIIERIDVEGDTVHIYSRALPKPKPVLPAAPPSLQARLGAGSHSTSLDLVPSSRASIDSSATDYSASAYLPETNTAYPTSPTSPDFPLVDVEPTLEPAEPLGDLVERVVKLGIVPAPPAAGQPFFRISPQPSSETLVQPTPKAKVKSSLSKVAPDAVPMSASQSGWGAVDDDEVRMAADYVRRTNKGSSGSRQRKGWL